jgi:formylmethanofuran dehydrogenase subunit E
MSEILEFAELNRQDEERESLKEIHKHKEYKCVMCGCEYSAAMVLLINGKALCEICQERVQLIRIDS